MTSVWWTCPTSPDKPFNYDNLIWSSTNAAPQIILKRLIFRGARQKNSDSCCFLWWQFFNLEQAGLTVSVWAVVTFVPHVPTCRAVKAQRATTRQTITEATDKIPRDSVIFANRLPHSIYTWNRLWNRKREMLCWQLPAIPRFSVSNSCFCTSKLDHDWSTAKDSQSKHVISRFAKAKCEEQANGSWELPQTSWWTRL